MINRSKCAFKMVLAKIANIGNTTPKSYLAAGGWFTANSMVHSLLLLWTRITSWIYCLSFYRRLMDIYCFHGLIGLIVFSLRQFEIAQLVLIRPYNTLAFLRTNSSLYICLPNLSTWSI